MRVIPVPCRSDNYMYIIVDDVSGKNAVVDPYDPGKLPLLIYAAKRSSGPYQANLLFPAKLEAAAKEHNLKLGEFLLTTHHHEDHSGGNKEFIAKYPGVKVYAGSDKAPGANHILKHNDTFKIGELEIKALATPCHTQDHICFFVEDKKKNERGVFTGDTLFISGCGRFFEGTAKEMNTALNKTLSALPDDTVTFVGHEYTKSNVAFSKYIDPTNPSILELVKFADENKVTTGIFTIGHEKKWNVFMRPSSQAVRDKTKTTDDIDAMGALREMKNNFRG